MKTKEFVLLVLVFINIVFMSFYLPEEPKLIPKIHKIPVEEKVLDIPCEEGIYYGIVSYYGERWNGRTTANMEIYDCSLLTCASPILPFNTVVKVTNLDNNKSITVRVNDRGPYKMDKSGKAIFPLIPHPKRVLDLSKESFKSIGDLKKGLLNIKYEIVG
jgi:rare lipoprotein A